MTGTAGGGTNPLLNNMLTNVPLAPMTQICICGKDWKGSSPYGYSVVSLILPILIVR